MDIICFKYYILEFYLSSFISGCYIMSQVVRD